MKSEAEFNHLALQVFRLQYQTNKIYRKYCELIDTNYQRIDHYTKIPFLPIQFFKTEKVQSGDLDIEISFKSSGTGGNRSTHHLSKKGLYEKSFGAAFNHFYGPSSEFAVLALLPSYLEQGHSSLVYMCDHFIKNSKYEQSGFFLYDHKELAKQLDQLKESKTKTLLIGVSYALLDFAEEYKNLGFDELIVMETGGMKGRKKELVRAEFHSILKDALGLLEIHSEYGMTELLSQAYSKGDGSFNTPPWMKIILRQQEDPFSLAEAGQSGGINVIDLANLYSCSFIQTEDLGRKTNLGIEVLGRFDNAEIRGCSQMAI